MTSEQMNNENQAEHNKFSSEQLESIKTIIPYNFIFLYTLQGRT